MKVLLPEPGDTVTICGIERVVLGFKPSLYGEQTHFGPHDFSSYKDKTNMFVYFFLRGAYTSIKKLAK